MIDGNGKRTRDAERFQANLKKWVEEIKEASKGRVCATCLWSGGTFCMRGDSDWPATAIMQPGAVACKAYEMNPEMNPKERERVDEERERNAERSCRDHHKKSVRARRTRVKRSR